MEYSSFSSGRRGPPGTNPLFVHSRKAEGKKQPMIRKDRSTIKILVAREPLPAGMISSIWKNLSAWRNLLARIIASWIPFHVSRRFKDQDEREDTISGAELSVFLHNQQTLYLEALTGGSDFIWASSYLEDLLELDALLLILGRHYSFSLKKFPSDETHILSEFRDQYQIQKYRTPDHDCVIEFHGVYPFIKVFLKHIRKLKLIATKRARRSRHVEIVDEKLAVMPTNTDTVDNSSDEERNVSSPVPWKKGPGRKKEWRTFSLFTNFSARNCPTKTVATEKQKKRQFLKTYDIPRNMLRMKGKLPACQTGPRKSSKPLRQGRRWSDDFVNEYYQVLASKQPATCANPERYVETKYFIKPRWSAENQKVADLGAAEYKIRSRQRQAKRHIIPLDHHNAFKGLRSSYSSRIHTKILRILPRKPSPPSVESKTTFPPIKPSTTHAKSLQILPRKPSPPSVESNSTLPPPKPSKISQHTENQTELRSPAVNIKAPSNTPTELSRIASPSFSWSHLDPISSPTPQTTGSVSIAMNSSVSIPDSSTQELRGLVTETHSDFLIQNQILDSVMNQIGALSSMNVLQAQRQRGPEAYDNSYGLTRNCSSQPVRGSTRRKDKARESKRLKRQRDRFEASQQKRASKPSPTNVLPHHFAPSQYAAPGHISSGPEGLQRPLHSDPWTWYPTNEDGVHGEYLADGSWRPTRFSAWQGTNSTGRVWEQKKLNPLAPDWSPSGKTDGGGISSNKNNQDNKAD